MGPPLNHLQEKKKMRVAISTDGEYVSAHFGRCPAFTILEIDQGRVVGREMIENPGHQPGFIPRFLHDKGVNCIIAGGMGPRAVEIFSTLGMDAIIGVAGKVSDTVVLLLEGRLKGGSSLCQPGAGKGYGLDKAICDHSHKDECNHEN
jgi:predicted Fe-Mo cluster-binding NifX family protein